MADAPNIVNTPEVPNKNVIASPATVVKVGVTMLAIAVGGTPLTPGQVIGRVTATGKYKPYNNANADGTEVATGILLEPQAADGIDKMLEIGIRGEFVLDQLVGLDAPAVVDLGGRQDAILNRLHI